VLVVSRIALFLRQRCATAFLGGVFLFMVGGNFFAPVLQNGGVVSPETQYGHSPWARPASLEDFWIFLTVTASRFLDCPSRTTYFIATGCVMETNVTPTPDGNPATNKNPVLLRRVFSLVVVADILLNQRQIPVTFGLQTFHK
jgi:hypothetical protein